MDWMIEKARQYREAGFATSFLLGSGYFEWGCWSRGFSQFCMDIVMDQNLVRELWDIWEQQKLETVERMVKPEASPDFSLEQAKRKQAITRRFSARVA